MSNQIDINIEPCQYKLNRDDRFNICPLYPEFP